MSDFQGQWAAASFHFRATLDGEQISFSKVEGLNFKEADIMEYRNGDSEVFITTKRLGLLKTPEITFSKGIFADDDRLLEMFNRMNEKEYYMTEEGRFDILVELLDEEGDTVMTWNITNAIPTKMTAPTLDSQTSEIAIETFSVVCEDIELTLQG